MPPEIINWLQDVSQHLRVAQQRRALRRPGRGCDYMGDPFKDLGQRVVAPLHPARMRLRVSVIVQETPSTKTFRFARVDGPLPPFRAGQYVNLFVDVDGVLTSRPYSISSAPGSATLDLTIRDNPGGFVAPYLLHEARVGAEFESTGPAGSFYHEPLIDGSDLVFLTGGSGITPFMSMIRQALATTPPSLTEPALSLSKGKGIGGIGRIHLLYGSRTPDDVIFDDELIGLAAQHDRLEYDLVISEPPPRYRGLTGFLDAGRIRSQVGDVAGKTFYVCGPSVMYDFCQKALAELGVPAHKIRRELFGPPADVTRSPGWPAGLSADAKFRVEVAGRQTIEARAGEPLMNSLERHGIVLPAICRAGACSACRTRLLAGRVFAPTQVGLRESDREHGYIHPCMSYPMEDLKIRV
jgi:ferredoxin-NADP reductase